eukprot:15345146-Ditylum_brightwellii.AAC.1
MSFCKETGMREVITERHGLGPATTRGNMTRQAIDGIRATHGVKITEGGYLPLHQGYRSNHRLLWIKLCLEYTFGTIEHPMRRPAARNLRTDDKRGQR